MNTTEQIVESYFRICRECFTIPDVKVHSGFGRQFDLLAYSLRNKEQYHVEIQVSHSRRFALTIDEMLNRFDSKFFGVPRRNDTKVRPKKKSYLDEIRRTYRWLGFSPEQVKRIWVCWHCSDVLLLERLRKYNSQPDRKDTPIEVLSFREHVIPELLKHVNTAHYEDVSLRTLSLLRQCKIQTSAAAEEKRQQRMPSD